MRSLTVASGAGPYLVHVGGGLLARTGALLREAGLDRRVAVIADENVGALYGAALLRSLSDVGFDAQLFLHPPGEEAKSLAGAEGLYGALIEAGFGRKDAVLALGGGVTGDLAGFVAATYHRGVDFVQVPTTLLAQVDSSVGGKVAVDHPLGKNLIGAFHPPRLVVADTDILSTLPIRERWSGLAEIAKAALIRDEALLRVLEDRLEALASEPDPEVIRRAIAIKAEVVAADEREGGLRRILNFGHTIGHGLETAVGYGALAHGEAVVLGMRAAISLSRLATPEAERAFALLRRFPIPTFSTPDRMRVLEAVRRDKKADRGRISFVLLERIGSAVVEPVDDAALEAGIEAALEAR